MANVECVSCGRVFNYEKEGGYKSEKTGKYLCSYCGGVKLNE